MFGLKSAVKQPESQSSTVCQLEVKWFNPSKGYGFLISKDGQEDIFLHFSVLDEAGYRYLTAGDEVSCELFNSDKGEQVVRILKVFQGPNSSYPAEFYDRPDCPAIKDRLEFIEGHVKWFNTLKGFGFVCPDDQGVDVFVHESVLRRLGLHKLFPGQKVKMQVMNSDRGRQAWALELIS